MIYCDPATGRCVEAGRPPDPLWLPVKGRGILFRRPESGTWTASYAYPPSEAPRWVARGWERVVFRPASPIAECQVGKRSRLRFALVPETAHGESLWVILPDEPGREAPAARPGAHHLVSIEDLRAGLPPARIAEHLLTARIAAAGLSLERSVWVLRGTIVSPDDARIARGLQPVLALAERLREDLLEAAGAVARDERG